MQNDYPIFLPNVISTNTFSNNRLTDKGIRLTEARNALFSLLERKLFKRVVIIDGSDHEILTRAEIDMFSEMQIEIEQLKFQQNVEQVRLFGKSNGEIQITNYMLENSRLVKEAGGFYKLSPRYFLENIDSILPKIINFNNFFYYYHPLVVREYKSFVCTAFYKMSVEFYREHFSDCISDCSLDVEGYLETVFFRRLNKLNKTSSYIEFPFFSGIGGTLGKPMKNRFYYFRNVMSRSGLLAYSF